MKRHFNTEIGWSRRCGHGWCSECKTRRGRNFGNRRVRRDAKIAIRRALRLES